MAWNGKKEMNMRNPKKLTISSMRKIKFHLRSRTVDKNRVARINRALVPYQCANTYEWNIERALNVVLCLMVRIFVWTIFSSDYSHIRSIAKWTPIGLLNRSLHNFHIYIYIWLTDCGRYCRVSFQGSSASFVRVQCGQMTESFS